MDLGLQAEQMSVQPVKLISNTERSLQFRIQVNPRPTSYMTGSSVVCKMTIITLTSREKSAPLKKACPWVFPAAIVLIDPDPSTWSPL